VKQRKKEMELSKKTTKERESEEKTLKRGMDHHKSQVIDSLFIESGINGEEQEDSCSPL